MINVIGFIISMSILTTIAFAQSPFPVTVIQSANSTSPYANELNPFTPDYGNGSGDYSGECTWYVFGRVIELVESDYLDQSVSNAMYNAFQTPGGRDANYWNERLAGNWIPTNNEALPYEQRRAGYIVQWEYGTYGHVAFVEEVDANRTQYRISEFNWTSFHQYGQSTWLPFEGDDRRGTGVYPRWYALELSDPSNLNLSVSQALTVIPSRVNPSTIYSLPSGYTPPESEKNIITRFRLTNNGNQSVTLSDMGVAILQNNSQIFRIELNSSVPLAPGQQSSLFDVRGYLADNYTNNQTTSFTARIQVEQSGTWTDVTGTGATASFTVYPRPTLANGMIIKQPGNPDMYHHQSGYKWHINSTAFGNALNGNWANEFYVYPSATVNPLSNPLHPTHNSTTPEFAGRNLLFKLSSNANIFIVEPNPSGGSLRSRQFANEAAFSSYGYPAGAMGTQTISLGSTGYNYLLSQFPIGDPINVTPAAPTGLTASDGGSTSACTISWTASSGATHYRVYRHTSNDSGSATALSSWMTSTTYIDNTATPGVLYYYWVRAATGASGDNASDYSSSDSGWRGLTAPAGVAASDGAHPDYVAVSWSASQGATNYRVYRNTTNNSGGAGPLGSQWQTTLSFQDATAQAGQTYYYWVKAAATSAGERPSDYSQPDTGYAQAVPVCVVSPASLDFGSTPAGDPVTRTFTVTNTGGGTLTGMAEESCSAFSISNGSYSLGAGQSHTVTVTLQSDVGGTYFCGVDAGSDCAQDVICSGLVEMQPICQVVPTGLDFGTTPPSAPVSRTFTISNIGGGTLSGEAVETCEAFFITNGSYSLSAGQSQAVTVTIQSDVGGTYFCGVDAGTNCSQDVSCSGVVDAGAECLVSPTQLDFGTTAPGQSVSREFTITNVGGGTLTGTATGSCNGYSISNGGYSLGAGQSQTVSVTLQSGNPGTFTCLVDAGVPCLVDVGCTGVVESPPLASFSVTEMEFGTVLPGTTVYRSCTLTNVGGGILEGTLFPGCPAYQVVSGASFQLAAGQSQTVMVLLQSMIPGDFPCQLLGGEGVALPLTGAVIDVQVVTGAASTCGLVEILGHLEGSTFGFLPDWNQGEIGLLLSPAPDNGVQVRIMVNGTLQHESPAMATWTTADRLDLTPWLNQNITLHLEVSDGQGLWNLGGTQCQWELDFLDIANAGLPARFFLGTPVPNPFNPSSRLQVDLPLPGHLLVKVLNLRGGLVETLVNEFAPAGSREVTWSPRNQASGLYFVIAEFAGQTSIQRVLLLR